MESDSNLLEAAKPYCHLETGEVHTRMPDELMQQLRKAKLALGVGGRHNENTGSHATWYVFFNDEIRENVTELYREARRHRRQRAAARAAEQAEEERQKQAESKASAQRGLGSFVRNRRT